MGISLNDISYTYELPEELTDTERREVGRIVVDEMKKMMSQQRSPVTGSRFTPLSKEYADKKRSAIGSSKADLNLTGDHYDSIKFRPNDFGVEIFLDPSQTEKMFNHNIGDTVPQRKSMPDEDQAENFDERIQSKVNDFVRSRVRDKQEAEAGIQDLFTINRGNQAEVQSDLQLSDDFIASVFREFDNGN